MVASRTLMIPSQQTLVAIERHNQNFNFPNPINAMRASRQNVDLGIPAPKEVYNYRVYVLALISSIGAVLFGYDLGFIGTALELESFKVYGEPLSRKN